MLKSIIAAAGCGALGVASRLLIEAFFKAHLRAEWLPWAIFAINLLGSFLIGLGDPYLREKSPELSLLLLAGFLGGFTTFSSYSLRALQLFAETGYSGKSLLYFLGQPVLGAVLCLLGIKLSKHLLVLLP